MHILVLPKTGGAMQDNPLRVEAVVNGLREDILNGKLERESRLPSERELAEKFDVSRVTVRTAISRLSQLGFVRTVPKSGTYVNDYLENASVDLLVDIIKNSRKVDNEMLLALTEVRKLIEVCSAGKCAQKITDEERFRLESLVADMENHAADPYMIAEKDYAFHMEIVRIGGNPVLRVLMNSTGSIFRYYLNYYYKMPGKAEGIRPFYKRFLKALEMKDERYAEFAMGEMLSYAEMGVKEAIIE